MFIRSSLDIGPIQVQMLLRSPPTLHLFGSIKMIAILMHGISSPYPAPLLTFLPTTSANALLMSLFEILGAKWKERDQSLNLL